MSLPVPLRTRDPVPAGYAHCSRQHVHGQAFSLAHGTQRFWGDFLRNRPCQARWLSSSFPRKRESRLGPTWRAPQEDKNRSIHFKVVDTGKTLVRHGCFSPWQPKKVGLISKESRMTTRRLNKRMKMEGWRGRTPASPWRSFPRRDVGGPSSPNRS
jgi:hypothetical protein